MPLKGCPEKCIKGTSVCQTVPFITTKTASDSVECRFLFLFRAFDGFLAEFFEEFRQFEGCFAGACAGGFVPFFYLCLSILCEVFELGFDFLE